jgi:plastocyanin
MTVADSSREVSEMKHLQTLTIGLAVVGLVTAVPVAAIGLLYTVGSDNHWATTNATMPHMSSAGMSGMMGSVTQAGPSADQLTILHVQKGCHVWSDGTEQAPAMQLTMKPGQMLRVLNQDVDMHRLMQLGGPPMMLGGPMSQGQAESLTFTKPGTYKFDTKVLPMKGMPEVETTGPDNTLRLTVTVE